MNIPNSSRLRWYQLICPGLRLSPCLPSKYRLGLNAKGTGYQVAIARVLVPWEKGESPVEWSLLLFGRLQGGFSFFWLMFWCRTRRTKNRRPSSGGGKFRGDFLVREIALPHIDSCGSRLLEHAGFASPCGRAPSSISGDRDTEEMEKLIELLAQRKTQVRP
jgi:hypothetical protein